MTQTNEVPAPGIFSHDPWEQRETETNAAFAAFAFYRDMGPRRSIRTAAKEAGKNGAQGQWGLWSRTYDWVGRCRDFDRENDRQAVAAMRALMVDRQAATTELQHEIADAMLRKGLERLKAVDVDKIPEKDLPRWLDVGVKIARQAVGLPTRPEVLDEALQGAEARELEAARERELLASVVDVDEQADDEEQARAARPKTIADVMGVPPEEARHVLEALVRSNVVPLPARKSG